MANINNRKTRTTFASSSASRHENNLSSSKNHLFYSKSNSLKDTSKQNQNPKILENMKKNDKFIGDVLAPFEQILGMKFNKFNKPEDPKYVEPKKKANLKLKLKKAQKKHEKLKNMTPDEAKKVHWKNALDRAQGIKVKDDPKMIKKVIKRKVDEKKRHKKKWGERIANLEEAKNIKKKRAEQRKNQRQQSKKKGKR